MRIRVNTDARVYLRCGNVIELPDALALQLVARGCAERLDSDNVNPPPQPPTGAEPEAAVLPAPAPRRRGRPRKAEKPADATDTV